jgi:ribonuclease HI
LLPKVPVGGRLSRFGHFWHQNVQDLWVNKIVSEGYSLEFLQKPSVVRVKETVIANKSHMNVLQREVTELLEKHAIEKIPVEQENAGFYSTFFVVPKKTGDLRPILNLKPLNKFLRKAHFKMETLQSIIKAVQPGDWMVSLDLKDAYLHIPIHPQSRPFLRFKLLGQVYQFRVLPFGLCSSPRVFTKVLAPIAALARLEGIHVFPYLDDWLLKDPQQLEISLKLQRLTQLLKEAGFVINLKKSQTSASQDLIFVGGRFRTNQNVVMAPPDRIVKLEECLQVVQVGRYVPVRIFLRLLGIMASMIPVVKFCRLFMRPLQLYLMACWNLQSRDVETLILIREDIRHHLDWWTVRQNVTVGMAINPPTVQEVVTTDASQLVGWGGHFREWNVQGTWGPEEAKLHINVLEMLAVERTLRHFQEWLKGKVVLVRSDNMTVVTYLNKEGGTKSPSLCMRVWRLLVWAKEMHMEVRAQHVPGDQNSRADKLSRWVASPLEWELNRQVVQSVFQVMGEPMIDLFATSHNKQVMVYCSRFPEMGAYHVDSLAMSWDNLFGYAFPPMCLIPVVLERIEQSQCVVILVAPLWPRRAWFPRLLDLLIEEPIVLPQRPDLLTQDNGQLQHPCPENWQLLAWKLSGDRCLRRGFLRKLSQPCRPQLSTPRLGCMTECGQYMHVGVVNGILIRARLL